MLASVGTWLLASFADDRRTLLERIRANRISYKHQRQKTLSTFFSPYAVWNTSPNELNNLDISVGDDGGGTQNYGFRWSTTTGFTYFDMPSSTGTVPFQSTTTARVRASSLIRSGSRTSSSTDARHRHACGAQLDGPGSRSRDPGPHYAITFIEALIGGYFQGCRLAARLVIRLRRNSRIRLSTTSPPRSPNPLINTRCTPRSCSGK